MHSSRGAAKLFKQLTDFRTDSFQLLTVNGGDYRVIMTDRIKFLRVVPKNLPLRGKAFIAGAGAFRMNLETTGYRLEEALGKNPRMLKSGSMPAATYAELWRTITTGKTWRGQFQNKKKSAELYWEHAAISPLPAFAGRIESGGYHSITAATLPIVGESTDGRKQGVIRAGPASNLPKTPVAIALGVSHGKTFVAIKPTQQPTEFGCSGIALSGCRKNASVGRSGGSWVQ